MRLAPPMRTDRLPLLIVEDDSTLALLLAREAEARGYTPAVAGSVAAADAALDAAPVAVALVDLALGSGSGFDAIRRIKAVSPEAEVTVLGPPRVPREEKSASVPFLLAAPTEITQGARA